MQKLDAPSGGVSVIICTRNRAESLERTLRSVAALDRTGLDEFELVVVNNGSTDATQAVIDAAARQSPFPVRTVLEPRPGLSIARNSGLAAARGTYILFTDDDCLLSPDWARTAHRLLAANPLQVIGGRVELHNPRHLKVSIKTSLQPETATPHEIFGFLLGANMACGRTVVDLIGPFDTRLGAGTRLCAGEDTEFAYRAMCSGIPVHYEPALVVSHDHRRERLDESYRLNRGYSVGAGALLMQDMLRGRCRLARPIYWDIRKAFRDRHTTPLGWRWPMLKLAFIAGAIRFLLQASWRKPF